jgi:hypothetical protein
MKSRIAAVVTAVALVGGTMGALAIAGSSSGSPSASAAQYCQTDNSCGSTPIPPPPKGVSWSSHTLRPGHPIIIGFRLTKPGTVHIRLLRTVHGKTIVVGTVTITYTKTGTRTFALKTKFAGHKLAKGNYTLSVYSGKGKNTSKATKTKLNVG